ncbi:hypothetical protein Tco_0289923 [Tanacetum coccineum]
MTTLAEFMIIAGAENRPPMLEKSFYDSWKRRMEHYRDNRENGRMILSSVQNGPLIWPTINEADGTTQTKKYEELSTTKKIQADCDCKATNIVLQGLPPDVYAIVNHHKVAKEIWDIVKLLMQGTKLSKMTPSHLNAYQYTYNNPQFQQQFSPSQSPHYGSIPPTQHYSTTYPSTPLAISYPSTPYPNAYASTVHQEACPQPPSVPQIEYTVSIINQQTHMVEFPQIDSSLEVLVFKQGDDPINVYCLCVVIWIKSPASPTVTKPKAKARRNCVDGILVDGASWSIEVDTCESAKSTALGAEATGTREIATGGGLKSHKLRPSPELNFKKPLLSAHQRYVDGFP